MARKGADGKQYVTSRETYKAVKKYDHQDFDAFCSIIYQKGFEAGVKAGKESVKGVDYSILLDAISGVKGVGPSLSGKIKAVFEEQFGGAISEKTNATT